MCEGSKRYFEGLNNVSGNMSDENTVTTGMIRRVFANADLDIRRVETEKASKKLKPGKSAGLDGVATRI